MKLFLLSLLFIIPSLVLASPISVSVFSLSPYFESGQTNTFLVSMRNYGTNNISIPSGLKMDNGIVIPTCALANYSYTDLTNGIPVKGSHFCISGNMSTTIDHEVLEQALETLTHDEVMNQLYGKHYLKPRETITYKVTWACDPEHRGFSALNTVMITVFLNFKESDIEVPPISLYQKQKSNQQVDPIVTTPVDEVEAQGTQGHP